MEQVDDRPALSHEDAALGELARRRRIIAMLLLAAVAGLALVAWGIWYDVQHGYYTNKRTRADGTDEGGNWVLPAMIVLALVSVAIVRNIRLRRLRRLLRGSTWREVELSSLDNATPRLARETYGTHWYKFPDSVPRHFRAAIATHGPGSPDPPYWCAIRPLESSRVFLTRTRGDEPRTRPEPASTAPGLPRWRIDDVAAVTCALTPDGLERGPTDGETEFATCVLHRPQQDGPLELWQPRGPRLGHIAQGDRRLELHEDSGSVVVELESRFDVSAFWHRGVRVGCSNRSRLQVGDWLLSCGPWRRWSRLSGSHYRLLDGDCNVVASARQTAWGGHVSVWIAPRVEPIAAAVIVLHVAAKLTRRR